MRPRRSRVRPALGATGPAPVRSRDYIRYIWSRARASAARGGGGGAGRTCRDAATTTIPNVPNTGTLAARELVGVLSDATPSAHSVSCAGLPGRDGPAAASGPVEAALSVCWWCRSALGARAGALSEPARAAAPAAGDGTSRGRCATWAPNASARRIVRRRRYPPLAPLPLRSRFILLSRRITGRSPRTDREPSSPAESCAARWSSPGWPRRRRRPRWRRGRTSADGPRGRAPPPRARRR